MRGDYEAKNDRHPFQVQFIGIDDIGVRNLTTDEVVVRERKISSSTSEAQSKEQFDRLDALAYRLAQERKEEALKLGAQQPYTQRDLAGNIVTA
jgi:hypothetical protein